MSFFDKFRLKKETNEIKEVLYHKKDEVFFLVMNKDEESYHGISVTPCCVCSSVGAFDYEVTYPIGDKNLRPSSMEELKEELTIAIEDTLEEIVLEEWDVYK